MNQKPKRQRRRTRQGPSAKTAPAEPAAKTGTDTEDAESTLDRVMHQAAQPGRLVTYVVILVIIVVGWRWPQYVVDPTSVGGRAHDAVAAVIASITFLLFSTLTLLAYCLAFGGPTEVNKAFVAAVLNRAGIGATLGTLLGVRLAPALLGPASGPRATFPEYLGDVGNTVTLLTLVLVATVWPYSLGPFRRVIIGLFERFPLLVPVSLRKWIATLLVVGVNASGASLAFVVYLGLAR